MAANIRSLTALRGIAALTVLIFHCSAPLFGGAEQVPMPLNRGYLAVDLFFLLSGFVLTHVHERDFAEGVAWADVKSFLRARLARIYPIHILTLLLLLPLYGSGAAYSGFALVQNLFLTQIWCNGMSWNYGAWSISAEWHAYLLFPILVTHWRQRAGRETFIILLLCLAVLSLTVLHLDNDANIAVTPAVLLRSLPEFIAGMGLYRVYRGGWMSKFMADDRTAVCAAIAVVGLASLKGTDIAVIAALAVLLLACAHNRGRADRYLTARAPMFLGRISYSLYMVQMIAGTALAAAAPWVGSIAAGHLFQAIAFAALSFALAIPVSRYVEFPMRDWLRGKAPSKTVPDIA